MKDSICSIEGVFSSALNCGIRVQRPDLAYIYVPQATACAAVFTKNKFAAPSILRNKEVLPQTTCKAIIINSGNANVMTGEHGEQANQSMAEIAAQKLHLKTNEVLTASTGIIGIPIPIEKIEIGLVELLKDPYQQHPAITKAAILTTDLVEKEETIAVNLQSGEAKICGIAKGSGMIAPNMATMLAFLVTDVDIPQKTLQEMLRKSCDLSFNMISVDTDTSTSDQLVIFSTGKYTLQQNEYLKFQEALNSICIGLAKKIARDGEGATKLIEVRVDGAASDLAAKTVARSIAESPLVKTAIHGADPNWGRVIMAIGKNPEIAFDPNKIDLSFQGQKVLNQSKRTEVTRENLRKLLDQDPVLITVNLHSGNHSATFWSCDLTKGYIEINVDYN